MNGYDTDEENIEQFASTLLDPNLVLYLNFVQKTNLNSIMNNTAPIIPGLTNLVYWYGSPFLTNNSIITNCNNGNGNCINLTNNSDSTLLYKYNTITFI
jgi:hypothetical protein